MDRGLFIVLEGLDGSGTTSQLKLLSHRLQKKNHPVHVTREPSDGPVGQAIRQTLRSTDGAAHASALPLLFAGDRADHLEREIVPALMRGTTVLCDRYYHSSLAYQSLNGDLSRILALNAGFMAPDITLYLRIPVATAVARISARGAERELFEQQETLRCVSRSYETAIRALQTRGEHIVHINGDQPIEEVSNDIWAEVATLHEALTPPQSA